MIESYNILILLQFEGFYADDHHIKREFTEKNSDLDEKLKELKQLKEQLKNE